jgi:hypothetical protein
MVAAYALVAWAICQTTGKPQFYNPLIYMPLWNSGLTVALTAYIFAFELPMAVRENPRRPLAAFAARLRAMAPRLLPGLALYFAAGVFTGTFTTLKSLANAFVPFRADGLLASVDSMLHLGVDPWKLLQPLLGHHAVTHTLQKLYLSGWAVTMVGFTALVAFSPRLAHLRSRFFLTYFAAWIVLGNLVAALFMSGGPVYFGEITGDHARFADQLGYLAFSKDLPFSSAHLQDRLWAVYQEGRFNMGTGISAFPSLHVAMMTLFALTAFHIDRRLGWVVGAFALVILASSVHLAWHYAIDGYASAAFIVLCWTALGRHAARKSAAKPAP